MNSSSNNSLFRSFVIFSVKMTVGLGIFFYFWKQGKISFSSLRQREFLHLFLLLFALQGMILLITHLRWFLIARNLGIDRLRYGQSLFYVWIGQFFATFLPSAIASDFSKIFYLQRAGFPARTLVKSAILDRLISLFAVIVLFLTSIGVLAWDLPLFVFCIILLSVSLAYYCLRKRVMKLPPLSGVLASFVSFSLKSLSLVLVVAWLEPRVELRIFYLSVAGQLFDMVPLTPASLGVGHLAFDYLYSLGARNNGAQVYHLYFVSKVAFKVSGFLGWLYLRRRNH